VATLVRLGFTDGGAVSAAVRGWHAGRYRAMRSARARELLTELMPALLDALSRTTHPDAAFQRFDEFLSRLPAGVQLFALLQANPGLLDLIAEVMGGAPRLAEHLSRNPALLEAVLNHGFFDPLPSASALNEELQRTLAEAQDYQDVLDLTRRWARDRQFQAGLRVLRHISDADAAGRALSDIADVAIAALQPHVEAEFARLHGRLPGRGMSVLALGKLGGREMSIGSDLDLIFIYDAPDVPGGWDHAQSDGPKPLAPIHYYARLAQRFINALTAPTGEGKLFDIDMRLRPSGANGPIASSLEGFLRYQEENAWVWEHMALLRARPVAGDAALAADIERALRSVLTRPRDPKKLVKDVAEMRERVARQHPTDRFWDLKHVRGGLMDVEYLAQYPLLRHAAAHPGILRANTEDSFAALAAAGLMEPAVAEELIGAVRLWRRLQGFLRLTVGEDFDEAALPRGLRRSLAQASRVADFDRLKEVMAATMATVAGHYQRVIAAPALL
jgi:glutamate-ammonia-ligase adenylyltransferase